MKNIFAGRFFNRTLALATSMILVMSCTSPQNKREDLSAVASYSQSIESKNSPSSFDQPRSLTPEARAHSGYDPLFLVSGSGLDVAAAAVMMGAMAIGFGRVFTTDEVRTDLRGTCVYGEPENPAMVSPCVNVTVKLSENKSDILATTLTNQHGDFRFFIPKGQSYFVQVSDRKGRLGEFAKRVGRSDSIVIFLKP